MLSLGAHWAVLQSVAWVGMIVDYSSDVGLRQGVSMALDGNNPCSLCHAIQSGKSQERQQEGAAAQSANDLKLELLSRTIAIYPPSVEMSAAEQKVFQPRLPRQPDDPPPEHILT